MTCFRINLFQIDFPNFNGTQCRDKRTSLKNLRQRWKKTFVQTVGALVWRTMYQKRGLMAMSAPALTENNLLVCYILDPNDRATLAYRRTPAQAFRWLVGRLEKLAETADTEIVEGLGYSQRDMLLQTVPVLRDQRHTIEGAVDENGELARRISLVLEYNGVTYYSLGFDSPDADGFWG